MMNGGIVMARINNSQQTISNIIDVAAKLFAEKGYEQTTMQDIVEGLGMSKGAIFHHFKSKEDIVDAVVERFGEKLLSTAREVAADKSVPIHERIVKTVAAMSVNKNDPIGMKMMEHIHKPQNALLHLKIEKMTIRECTPILANLLREGVEHGVFDTEFPAEVIEMILCYTNTMFGSEHLEKLAPAEIQRKITGFIRNIERLAGAKNGSFDGIMRIFEEGV
jgi:AcrR family transcriptional regulator